MNHTSRARAITRTALAVAIAVSSLATAAITPAHAARHHRGHHHHKVAVPTTVMATPDSSAAVDPATGTVPPPQCFQFDVRGLIVAVPCPADAVPAPLT